MSADFLKEKLEHIEISGKPALLSASRIDRDSVPRGWYCYDLRGYDSDPGRPATLEDRVSVNFVGAVLSPSPLKKPATECKRLKGMLNYLGEQLTLAEFCEQHSLEYPKDTQFGLTEKGRRLLRDAADPTKVHTYDWFVIERFGQKGEQIHSAASLTGAIDRFNGLTCESKRLGVTKDEIATIDLIVTVDGAPRLDEGWQSNPRFAEDCAISEAVARLQLSIAGLEPQQDMTFGGM